MNRFQVCIPVCNGGDFLEQALESVAMQTLGGVEVIVSDNASTDSTPEILDRWSRRLPLRVIRQPETLPLLAHANALLDAMDGDAYMLLCHDDYLVRPDALALASEALDRNPDVTAVYCDLLYVNAAARILAERRFGRDGRFDADGAGLQSVRTARNCFGIPLAVRASALGVHRYDVDLSYTADVDLSWTVSQESSAFHIPEPLIANRYSARNTTWSMLSDARRAYLRMARKHGRPLNRFESARLGLVAFQVAQQKRLFGAYARMRS